MEMKFLFFVSLMLAAVDAELSNQEKHCVDSAFANQTLSSQDDIELCEKFFKDKTADFRSSFESRLGCNSSALDIANLWVCNKDCFLKIFDDHKISDLYIKGLISHLHYGTDESDGYLEDVRKTRAMVYENIGIQCLDTKMTAVTFQRFSEDTKTMNDWEKSCTRRYAFEKNLIDPADYNIDASNLSSYDCESIFTRLDKRITPSPVEQKTFRAYFGVNDGAISECENGNEVTKNELFEKNWLTFRTIASFDLSPEQLTSLQERMKSFSKSLSLVVLECIRDYCIDNCKFY